MLSVHIKQQFIGEINGVLIHDKTLFYSCQDLLKKVEERFEIEVSSEFVNDFVYAMERVLHKQGDEVLLSEIEWDITYGIENYNGGFADFNFSAMDDTDYFATINSKISKSAYDFQYNLDLVR